MTGPGPVDYFVSAVFLRPVGPGSRKLRHTTASPFPLPRIGVRRLWVPHHDLSRREFLKEAGAGAIGVGVGALHNPLVAGAIPADTPDVDRKKLIAALGNTLIPTSEGYPGYQHLEQYGITDEILKGLQMLSARDLTVFNTAAGEVFSGKTFLDLEPEQRVA